MAGILEAIVGGGIGQLVKDVVGSFKLSPGAKAEIEKEIEEHAQEIRLKEFEIQQKLIEYQAKEVEAASANIRAEAGSGDKYTSRARPTFLYMMIAIIGWNYIVVPFFRQLPIEFPEPLFWLFGSAVLGYTGARTWEKIGMPKGK